MVEERVTQAPRALCAGLVGLISACFSPSPEVDLPCTDGLRCPPPFVCDSAELICRRPVSFQQITAGMAHTCVTTSNGQVRCWGRGSAQRLGETAPSIGDDEHPSARPSLSLPTTQHLEAGSLHSCAVSSTGDVRCWGEALSGRTGYPGEAQNHAIRDEPVDIGEPMSQVSAANVHTCAVAINGDIYCWGDGKFGKLGNASEADIGASSTPAQAGPIDLGGRAISVATGSGHTCALLDTNKIRCWGRNHVGQLGYGTLMNISSDRPPAANDDVDVGADVLKITLGAEHTCALLASRNVRCWGSGLDGRLGYASTAHVGDQITPAQWARNVNIGGPVADVVAGKSHTCALLESGDVVCWGANDRGQLGLGLPVTESIGDDEEPVAAGLVNLNGAARLLAAGDEYTCVVMTDDRVRCWGKGHAGVLGCGNCVAPSTEPPDRSCDITTAADSCDVSLWRP